MAISNATVKDTFFHPQHLLMKMQRQSQGGSPCYFCDACGLLGTGTRYRCDQCDFDIHEACLTGLPRSISLAQIEGQDIGATLTRLDASRSCDGCKDSSPAGRYMYCCAIPGSGSGSGSGDDDVCLNLHPRCALLLTPGKQDYFHPQHLLSFYLFDDALTSHPCAVCERVCTGVQFRCGECDFNIHSGCLGLPRAISYAKHSSEHKLTLTRLKGSRWCDVCKETSNAGCYMYLCMPCKYDVHPRCVASLAPLVGDDGALQAQPQQRRDLNRSGAAGAAGRRHGRAHTVLNGIHAVSEVADAVDSVLTVVDTVNTLASAVGACTIM